MYIVAGLGSGGRAGAVRVAVVRAPAVLAAAVPAGALPHLLRGLARLAVRVKHVALGTTELVGLLNSAEELLLLSFTFVIGIILIKKILTPTLLW